MAVSTPPLRNEADKYTELMVRLYPAMVVITLVLTIVMATGGVTIEPPEFRDPANQILRSEWMVCIAYSALVGISIWIERRNNRQKSKKRVNLTATWVVWTFTKALLSMIVAILFFMALL